MFSPHTLDSFVPKTYGVWETSRTRTVQKKERKKNINTLFVCLKSELIYFQVNVWWSFEIFQSWQNNTLCVLMVSLILMDRGAKVIGTKTLQGLNPGRFHHNLYGIIWRDGYLQKIQHFSQGYSHRQKIERGTLPPKGTLHIMDQKRLRAHNGFFKVSKGT